MVELFCIFGVCFLFLTILNNKVIKKEMADLGICFNRNYSRSLFWKTGILCLLLVGCFLSGTLDFLGVIKERAFEVELLIEKISMMLMIVLCIRLYIFTEKIKMAVYIFKAAKDRKIKSSKMIEMLNLVCWDAVFTSAFVKGLQKARSKC